MKANGKAQVYLAVAVALGLIAAIGPAQSQGGDPIGRLAKTSTFSRAERINLGKTRQGAPVCYFREEGSSHILDIGVSRDGVFLRVEHGDDPLDAAAIPRPPLKVFAGKALVDSNEKVTGEYQLIQVYDGAVTYVPNLTTQYGAGFAVIAKGDAKSFLATVVRAHGELMVVQSAANPKNVDIIAIYKFDAKTMNALLSCAAKHLQN